MVRSGEKRIKPETKENVGDKKELGDRRKLGGKKERGDKRAPKKRVEPGSRRTLFFVCGTNWR